MKIYGGFLFLKENVLVLSYLFKSFKLSLCVKIMGCMWSILLKWLIRLLIYRRSRK